MRYSKMETMPCSAKAEVITQYQSFRQPSTMIEDQTLTLATEYIHKDKLNSPLTWIYLFLTTDEDMDTLCIFSIIFMSFFINHYVCFNN